MITEIFIWVVTVSAIVLASIFVFRANFQFSLNEWQRDRKQRLEQNLRLLCPHVEVEENNGDLLVRSTFFSPFGTTAFQCQLCGKVTHDKNSIITDQKYWADNLMKLLERKEKMNKIAKKLGRG